MTLFLKIFLWFWLAMALIVGALMLVTRTFHNEPIVRQWQIYVGETMTINSQTAAQIYEAEGTDGLERFLNRLRTSQRTTAVGLFRQNGEQIAGDKFQINTSDIFNKALGAEETEFERSNSSLLSARKTT